MATRRPRHTAMGHRPARAERAALDELPRAAASGWLRTAAGLAPKRR
jgi:hypothetical protein